MKVLHINTEKSWRGGEQQLAYLMQDSGTFGMKNFVFCRSSSAISFYCTKNKIPNFTLPSFFFNTFLAGFYLALICKRKKISIVHAHSSKAHSLAVIGALIYKKLNIYISRRVIFPPKYNLWTRIKYNHAAVKKIICISNAVRTSLIPVVKDKSKLAIVFSGIDIEKITQAPKVDIRKTLLLKDDVFIIGNISALNTEKDLFTFIDAANILLKNNAALQFIVIGKGPLLQDLERYVARYKLKDKILFIGFKENVTEWLKDFDMFLFTSRAEGLGTSLLDAFAAGIPVVSTNSGGIPEVVIDGTTGLLAEAGNAMQLAKAVDRLLKDGQLREQLLKNAKKHLLEFSKDKMAEETYRIYFTNESSSSV